MKKVWMASILCIFLVGCGDKEINEAIPADVNSAREVAEAVAPYVEDYWDREYHLGTIQMSDLNSEQQGRVTINYADESDEDEPNVIQVVVDTAAHQVLQIQDLGSDSKINPGKIALDQWKLDSTDALEVMKKELGYPAEFKPDSLLIQTLLTSGELNRDRWWIIFQDWKQDLVHDFWINAYTGEVMSKETRKLHRGQTDGPLP